MNNTKIIFCLLIVMLSSCKNTNNYNNFSVQKDVKCIRTNLNCDNINTPYSVVIKNNTMIIADYYYKHQLSLIDLNKYEFIKQFCPTGRGPFEVSHTTSISLSPNNKNLVVFDSRPKKFVNYSIDSLETDTYIGKDEDFIQTDYHLYTAIKINNNYAVATIVDFEKRYGLFSINGSLLKKFGEYPTSEDSKIPINANPLTFQFTLKKKPKSNRFVATCYKSPIIEIFDIQDTIVSKIAKHQYDFPKVEATITETFSSVASLPESVYGFMDVTVSDSCIYALYSGRTPAEYPNSYSYSNTIYVYDWNGNQKQIINIDKDLVSLAYSKNNNCLFGFSESPELCLYKIIIPKL